MTPRTPNTRPTDAEIVNLLTRAATYCGLSSDDPMLKESARKDAAATFRQCIAAADALEAASAEPRTYGDGEARYATPEAAATDSVAVRETFDEYDYVRYASYKGATRRDVIRAVLRSVGMETQEPYTVSGVDYTFTEVC